MKKQKIEFGFALLLVLVSGFVSQAQASCLLGKVYLDSNSNQMQDNGEKGVANARLYTSSGLAILTDEYGRYSYCGRDSRSVVVKFDASSVKSVCAANGVQKASAGTQFVAIEDATSGRGFLSHTDDSNIGGGLGRADFGLRCQ